MRASLIVVVALMVSGLAASDSSNIVGGEAVAPHRGVYEVTLGSGGPVVEPFVNAPTVVFKRPDGSLVTVESFYDGDADGKALFKARAYCDQTGRWSWSSGDQKGRFKVKSSELPGKLRAHPEDPHQFAYDNGEWFLHIGDTGYRYVVDTEPEWQAYIDQAAKMGATKVRTWFCRSRSGVEALFTEDRSALSVPYWQEIDRRVQYALNNHPRIMFQLIPYGEDGQELVRYAQGDKMSRVVARYAQARFSALPNVTWCISNDQILVEDGQRSDGRRVPASAIDAIGKDMAQREPWGTLLTNHQARYSGYAFVDAPWSDITTLEDLNQVAGALVLEYRQKAARPVVNDEDRYELHERSQHPPYYFRRLMWSSLLSGGHATYGGARTYEAYDGKERGVRGYYDLLKEGIVRGGADHFNHIHEFFKETGLTLVGMKPADNMAGDDPHAVKVAASDKAIIAYLANPDSDKPGEANAAARPASCRLRLPAGKWRLRWFKPGTGAWAEDAEPVARGGEASRALTAPFEGDAVLFASRRAKRAY